MQCCNMMIYTSYMNDGNVFRSLDLYPIVYTFRYSVYTLQYLVLDLAYKECRPII